MKQTEEENIKQKQYVNALTNWNVCKRSNKIS